MLVAIISKQLSVGNKMMLEDSVIPIHYLRGFLDGCFPAPQPHGCVV